MLFGQPTTLTRICNRRFYRVLAACFDALALLAAWLLTIEARLMMNPYMEHQLAREDLRRLATPLAGVMILWALIAMWVGLYRRSGDSWIGGSLLRALESDLLFGTLAIVFTFFSRGFGADLFSRSFVLLFVPVSFVMLLVARYALLLAASTVEMKWPSMDRVAVAGDGPHAQWVINRIRASDDPVALVGLILPASHLPANQALEAVEGGVKVLGKTTRLAELINQERIDRLIIANGCLSPSEFEECTRISRSMSVIADHELGPAGGLRLSVAVKYGMTIVEMRPAEFTRIQLLVKRVFDVVVSSAMLVLFSPLLGAVAILIKLTSPGPVLYHSIRVGKGGRHFGFLKFRSMCTNADVVLLALERAGLVQFQHRDFNLVGYQRYGQARGQQVELARRGEFCGSGAHARLRTHWRCGGGLL